MLEICLNFVGAKLTTSNDHDAKLDPASFGDDSTTSYHSFTDAKLAGTMNRDKIPRAYDLNARRER